MSNGDPLSLKRDLTDTEVQVLFELTQETRRARSVEDFARLLNATDPQVRKGERDLLANHLRSINEDTIATTPEAVRALLQVLRDRQARATFDSEIERLGALHRGDRAGYERARRDAAKRLGLRLAALDSLVHGGGSNGSNNIASLNLHNPEPWPGAVDGAEVLHQLEKLIREYVSLPPHATVAVALWIMFAHSVDCFDVAPRLAILSAVMRSGKTTLLRIISSLVPRALLASNISPAAIYRVIELAHPTLLADEVDSFARENEELRGILNSGHDRDAAFVIRCDGNDFVPRRFSTWGAIAMAAIGRLPATWIDRSIVINLKRRLPSERIERLKRSARNDFEEVARRCARWGMDHADRLREAQPCIPEELNDRAAQNWHPLLAIADAACGDWPQRAREAAVYLSGDRAATETSLGVTLLSDIREVLGGADRIKSQVLCEALAEIEGQPWAEYGKARKPISANQLARLLAPFGIVPHTIRIGYDTAKGYEAKDFTDAFARYVQTATSSQPNGDKGNSDFSNRNTDSDVTDGNAQSAYRDAGCDGVTDTNPDPPPGIAEDAEIDRIAHVNGWTLDARNAAESDDDEVVI